MHHKIHHKLKAHYHRHKKKIKVSAAVIAAIAACLVVALAFSSGIFQSQAQAKEIKPYNVLLISIDTLRADRVGAFGYDRNTTPSLDALAKESVIFENYYAQAPFTPVSHMSTLSGLYPESHGFTPETPVPDSVKTMPEYFKDFGYYTAAVVSTVWLYPQYGFAQGFDKFDTSTRGPQKNLRGNAYTTERVMRSDYVNREALPLFDRNGLQDFFYFVHYYDVHSDGPLPLYYSPKPYSEMFYPEYDGNLYRCFLREKCFEEYIHPFGSTPEEQAENFKYIEASYDGGIAYTDAHVGELLQKVKDRNLWDSTMIIVIADHGEEFFEHGQWNHQQLYNESLHIPLLIKFPNSEHAGEKVEKIVQSIDLLPTVLEYFGIAPDGNQEGKSMMPLIRGENESWDEMVFSSNTRRTPWSFDQNFFLKYQDALRNVNDVDQIKFKRPVRAVRSDLKDLMRALPEGTDKNSIMRGLSIGAFPEKSLRIGDWKYIMRFRENNADELYDLAKDPEEKANIIRENPEIAKDMRRRIMLILAGQKMPSDAEKVPELSQDQLDELKALGYIN